MSDQLTIPEDVGTDPFGQAGIRQHVLAVLSAASLILLAVSTLLGLRSYFFFDQGVYSHGSHRVFIASVYGRMAIQSVEIPFAPNADLPPGWAWRSDALERRYPDMWTDSIWKMIGIEWRPAPLGRIAPGVTGWSLRISWRTLAALSLVLPLIHIWRERRQRKLAAGEPTEHVR